MRKAEARTDEVDSLCGQGGRAIKSPQRPTNTGVEGICVIKVSMKKSDEVAEGFIGKGKEGADRLDES